MMNDQHLPETSGHSRVVEVVEVHKSYDDLKAVAGVSFAVQRGEVFGLLGPNGAGKTTTLEMIEGLREMDSGYIAIAGYNVQTHMQQVRELIGVQLQSTSLYNKITVGEALDLYGGYYHRRRSTAELLELVSLEDKRDTYHMKLSGGQQQRLALALALVNDPLVVFLDEPTTGLDPQARHNIWEIIERMVSAEKTVLLTTHYMEEAERLCDRVAIMDHGKLIALGKPAELIGDLHAESCLRFSAAPEAKELTWLQELPGVSSCFMEEGRVELFSNTLQATLTRLLEDAAKRGLALTDLHIRRPTLEDVFLQLTGRSLRE